MKALWTGEEVTYEGRYCSIHNARMGYTPVQRPHPPIWNAAYSIPAARRAATICDGLYIANQATWGAAQQLADEYRRALQECGKTVGMVGANRNMAIAPTYEEAARAAQAEVARSAAFYGSRGMQESSTLEMVLDPAADPRVWSIVGTPQDCLEQISQQNEAIGFDWIGLSFMNLPKDHRARLEYVQYVSEELLSKLVAK
jgi:alkanesulfonate monooxygenase SsuD/methylene tetrahydromethanopterin reductase-like flavin-dependent oxidoreductase (luciferase family)